ncbi:hypothetical protein BTE56_17080 [Agrobacterium pusense]|nr:hypothetical protein BTE56_17080 [Agrobacterium pusense]SDF62495.1 Putative inner membrane protein [Agrobacterium pusense]
MLEHRHVASEEKHSYKMSFVVGGLFLNESIELVHLHDSAADWNETRELALARGITSLPKADSRRRILREIISRLSKLTETEVRHFAEAGDRIDQQSLLWLAVCREYRFVQEFAIEVVRERFLSLQIELPLQTFDTFFAAKAEWNEGLAKISPATRTKLRQILFRIMREAGIISPENTILASYISPQLYGIISERNPSDLHIFPGLRYDRGIA